MFLFFLACVYFFPQLKGCNLYANDRLRKKKAKNIFEISMGIALGAMTIS